MLVATDPYQVVRVRSRTARVRNAAQSFPNREHVGGSTARGSRAARDSSRSRCGVALGVGTRSELSFASWVRSNEGAAIQNRGSREHAKAEPSADTSAARCAEVQAIVSELE